MFSDAVAAIVEVQVFHFAAQKLDAWGTAAFLLDGNQFDIKYLQCWEKYVCSVQLHYDLDRSSSVIKDSYNGHMIEKADTFLNLPSLITAGISS